MIKWIVIPTFREIGHVRRLITFAESCGEPSIKIIIVNSDYGDATSSAIERHNQGIQNSNLVELPSNPNNFWSASVNIGLRYALKYAAEDDYVLIANVDTILRVESVNALVSQSLSNLRAITVAPGVAEGVVRSTAVRMKSWMLNLTAHIYRGRLESELRSLKPAICDFAPTRLVAIPYEILRDGGLASEDILPHYGGDYELTWRLSRRANRSLLLVPEAFVEFDLGNTGVDPRSPSSSISVRLKNITSIRASYNPYYRTRFIAATFPRYSIVSAIFVGLLKTALEIILGPRLRLSGVKKLRQG